MDRNASSIGLSPSTQVLQPWGNVTRSCKKTVSLNNCHILHTHTNCNKFIQTLEPNIFMHKQVHGREREVGRELVDQS